MIAISGLNIVLVAGIFFLVFKIFGIKRSNVAPKKIHMRWVDFVFLDH